MEVKFEDIKNIYDKEVKVNTKNKKKVYKFEMYKMDNITKIYNILSNNLYKDFKYNIFLIKDPKYRAVMSLSISDKIINHYVARYILIPKLERFLDIRNVATRKNLGRDYGIMLVKKYLEYYKHKNKKCYIMKLDISKYFYNIDHLVLKNMYKDYLNNEEKEIMDVIIDSTNKPYINETIKRLKKEELKICDKRSWEVEEIPFYNKGKGLPIGNMTSQFLAIYYLNALDHKIVHDYKIKHYVRYMDDFLLICDNKEYLIKVKELIEKELNTVYCLKLNPKKTRIVVASEGFTFCGYHFRVINNKTIITVCKSTRNHIYKRIKELRWLYRNGFITLKSCFCSIETYYNGFKYGGSKKIKRMVDRRFFG